MEALPENEVIVEEFSLFGFDDIAENVLEKVRITIRSTKITIGQLVSAWVAYSQNHGNTSLDEETFNRFLKELDGHKKPSKKVCTTPTKPPSSTLKASNDDNIFAQYGGQPTPPLAQVKRGHTTPDDSQKKRRPNQDTPATPVNGNSISHVPQGTTPSRKYISRSNRGEIVSSYGDCRNVQWATSSESGLVNINIIRSTRVSAADKISAADNDGKALADRFRYMFQKVQDKSFVLNKHLESLAECVIQNLNVEEEELASVQDKALDQVLVCGHIACDCDGRLNTESVVIQGSVHGSCGRFVPVNIKGVDKYSLFPGQVVVLKGINPDGKRFQASHIYTPEPPPLQTIRSSTNLKVVVACGPFTPDDGDSYKPLDDLITALRACPPDLCILTGPWVDCKNQVSLESTRSYDDIFHCWLTHFLEQTAHLTEMKIIIVPSQRDLHHDPIYPTPAYRYKSPASLPHERVLFTTDPCLLEVNGILFGITATDVLFQIGAEEISWNADTKDRMSRLFEHLLAQRSFFPIYPPSMDFNLDLELNWEYSRLDIQPHILIVSSDLHQFVKSVHNTLCINPGRLSKGVTGGTYARLSIECPSSTQTVADYSQAEILRI